MPQLTLDPNSEFPSLGRSNLVTLLGTWHPEMKSWAIPGFLDYGVYDLCRIYIYI